MILTDIARISRKQFIKNDAIVIDLKPYDNP
jgi:hypothetical protein